MTLENFLSYCVQLVSRFSTSTIGGFALLGVFALGLLIALVHVIFVIVKVK